MDFWSRLLGKLALVMEMAEPAEVMMVPVELRVTWVAEAEEVLVEPELM